VLLVVSFRPEFVAPWFGRPRVSLMALNRLDRPDATALAAEAVKSHVLSSQLLDRIVLQSDGVPLFIEELTKTVLEASEFGTAGAALAAPNTLQSLADGAPRSAASGQDGCSDRLGDRWGVAAHTARGARRTAGRAANGGTQRVGRRGTSVSAWRPTLCGLHGQACAGAGCCLHQFFEGKAPGAPRPYCRDP
jgi:hypothetical protein